MRKDIDLSPLTAMAIFPFFYFSSNCLVVFSLSDKLRAHSVNVPAEGEAG